MPAINRTLLSSVEVRSRAYEIRDFRTVGFIANVNPSGRISFYAQLGRGRKRKVGSYPQMTIEMARKRVIELQREPLDTDKTTLRAFIQEKHLEIDMVRFEFCYGKRGLGIMDIPMSQISADDVDSWCWWRKRMNVDGIKASYPQSGFNQVAKCPKSSGEGRSACQAPIGGIGAPKRTARR